MQDFWSDDEDEPGKRRRAARGVPRPPRPGGPAKLRHHIVTHYNTVTQVGRGDAVWKGRSCERSDCLSATRIHSCTGCIK